MNAWKITGAGLAALGAAWSLAAFAEHAGASPAARQGQAIAETICSNCHSVAPDQPATLEVSPAPPSFAEIADDPKTTAQSLRRFIATTHWDARTLPMTMPNPMLLDQDSAQVAAYILSLRSPAAAAAAAARAKLAPRPGASRIEAGEEIALRQCSLCHVVTSDPRYRPSLTQPTPSFAEIANAPGTTARSLRRFIGATHWDETTIPMTMPDQMLAGKETDDVVAYVLSLRKGR